MIKLIFIIGIVRSLKIYTSLSQKYQLKLLEDEKMHPWVYDSEVTTQVDSQNDQAFTDWSNNQVRQIQIENDQPYIVNITIRILSNSQLIKPYFQESVQQNMPTIDTYKLTLQSRQIYQLKLEYNCTDKNTESSSIIISLAIEEQTFKQNINVIQFYSSLTKLRDELNQYIIRLFKFCINPTNDYWNIIQLSFITLIITTSAPLISLFVQQNTKNQDQTVQISYQSLAVAVLVLPLIFSILQQIYEMEQQQNIFNFILSYYRMLSISSGIFLSICLFSLIYTVLLKMLQKPFAVSLILTIIFFYLNSKFNFDLVSFLFLLFLLIEISRRIVIQRYQELFGLLIFVWVQEIFWISHYHQAEKHTLYRSTDLDPNIFFPYKIYISQGKNQSWHEKYTIYLYLKKKKREPEIHLYQLTILCLVVNFVIRCGLFNRQHVMKILVVIAFQFIGEYLWCIAYRNKMNPPFLTMVTGLMMIGITMNFFVSGKDPHFNQMIRFQELKKMDNINLKIVN